MSIDLSISRIRSYAAYKGWKRARLAAEAGMHNTTLRNFGHPDWNPTVETLRQLEAIIPADFDEDAAPMQQEPEAA